MGEEKFERKAGDLFAEGEKVIDEAIILGKNWEHQQIIELLEEVFEEWKELQNGAPTQRLKERYAFGIKALRDLKQKLEGPGYANAQD